MAGLASKPGLGVGLVFGGICCLGLLFLAIATAIILSLIATYTTNHSVQPYGERYRLAVTLLKSLYTNDSGAYFSNGSIVDSADLSALCSTEFRKYYPTAAKQFYACVLTNGSAYSTTNLASNSKKRRRRAADSAFYGFYELDLYYSVSCPGNTGVLNYISYLISGQSNTACRATRLNNCNAFANLANGTPSIQWIPSGSSLAQTVYASNLRAFDTILTQSIYPFTLSQADRIGMNSSINLSGSSLNQTVYGCQYVGKLSQAEIAAIVAAQYSPSYTTPSSTIMAG